MTKIPRRGHSPRYESSACFVEWVDEKQDPGAKLFALGLFTMTVVEDTATDESLDAAYAWLCHRRKDYPDHADVPPSLGTRY